MQLETAVGYLEADFAMKRVWTVAQSNMLRAERLATRTEADRDNFLALNRARSTSSRWSLN